MDLTAMIQELLSKKAHIDQAIVVLERLAHGTGKRRSRPPKWLAALQNEPMSSTAAPKKHVRSLASRKRMAEAQRKRWAAKPAESK